MLPEYQYKTKPFKHQHELSMVARRETKAWAHFWEQGAAKTKPMIDLACDLYERGEIDAVIVVAPNGVHRNWKSDEIPAHMPDRFHKEARVEFWQSEKSGTKWFKNQMEALLKHKGFPWLLMSYNGFMTEKGKKYVWKFLKTRRVFYILDEAHSIKPGSKRTKSIVASGVYAPWRRILTGTPISLGPFDVYGQLKFLDERFWKDRGFPTFTEFKTHYGVWRYAADIKREEGWDPGYDKLVGYRNLEELNEHVTAISDRVLKEDVFDLPPKLYTTRYFELNPEQAEAYTSLRDEYEYEFANGKTIDGALAIVRLLRLHQIVCGYAVTDLDEPSLPLGDSNPMLDEIKEITDGLHHPALIWCRFRKDIDQIMAMLGDKAVRYDGSLNDDDREQSKLAFQRPDGPQYFVANVMMSSGLTLVRAKTEIFASQGYRLLDRLQAEDRAHRPGMDEHPVNIIDLDGVLPNGDKTVTRAIIKNLRAKFDIAAQITGDDLRSWI